MPIVDVEIVSDQPPDSDLAQRLADVVGPALRGEPGRTWIRLRMLARAHYAESGGPLPENLTPIFVTITARRHPKPVDFESSALEVSKAVSGVTGVPSDNVHVFFGPDARGRTAFGGRLLTD